MITLRTRQSFWYSIKCAHDWPLCSIPASSQPHLQLPNLTHQPTATPQIYYALAIYVFDPAGSPARSTYLLTFLSAKPDLIFISAQMSPLPVIPESLHWHSFQNSPVILLPKCSLKHLPYCTNLLQWLVTWDKKLDEPPSVCWAQSRHIIKPMLSLHSKLLKILLNSYIVKYFG